MQEQIENSVDSERPIGEVFGYVITPSNWPQWAAPVMRVDTGSWSVAFSEVWS